MKTGVFYAAPDALHREHFRGAIRLLAEPDLNVRCKRCGHRPEEHHWGGTIGGRCCAETDRYELCVCKKFIEPEESE